MSLTSLEIIRLGAGDTQEPYILSDHQIEYFLIINDGNTTAAIDDAIEAVATILSIRAVSIRTEDLWEDNRDASKRYQEAISLKNTIKASSAYPVICGGTYKGSTVNQFDEENKYGYYNDYEDI
jgi:hypothetical protein